MATAIDICNMALSHLGQDSQVVNIDPPDPDPMSRRCAIFYPQARDEALQSANWSFNTRRAPLAEFSDVPLFGWRRAYALPAECLHVAGVFPPDAFSDLSPVYRTDPYGSQWPLFAGYTPQPYVVEERDGSPVLYTDQENAVVLYRAKITDATRFTPLFSTAVSYRLAAFLAGPIIRGSEGANAAKEYLSIYAEFLSRASIVDANQSNREMLVIPSHLRARA
jgi:hypothetical protein